MTDTRRMPRIGLTYLERVTALEQRLDGTHGRLDNIEGKVDDIHTLLIQAKGVIWVATKICAWIAGGVATLGVLVMIWKTLSGH